MGKVTRLPLLIVFSFIFCRIAALSAQGSKLTHSGGGGWTVTAPFQRDVFIENVKGAFSEDEQKAVGNKIMYFTHKGSVYLYFTSTGLIMRKDSVYKVSGDSKDDKDGDKNDSGDKDGLKNLRVLHMFTKMQWSGCNPSPYLKVDNETPDYFTFENHEDKTGQSSVTAHAWNKLTYKNLYPGIDVEFYYPENKVGLEYNIIVHPGADPSLVKIVWAGSTVAMNGNDAKINTGWDILTDHAPSAKDADGNPVSSAFSVSGNTVSFVTGSYDRTKTLTIDPFISATTLGGSNLAYDMGWDVLGNAYVYGGGCSSFYELQKYNSAGGLVWTHINNAFTYIYITGYFYGGMCTDKNTGTSYMCEGYAPPSNHVVKINSNGTQAALLSTGGVDEMWHIEYDYCDNQLVIATGGGGASHYAAILDTNCTNLQSVNILNNVGVQDQTLIGFDNAGKCYIGTCAMIFPGPYPNYVCQTVLPGLSPTNWLVPDNHTFQEISNISYYPILGGYVCGNGFNGLVATTTFAVTYDGKTLRKWKASNGTAVNNVVVGANANAWGGLDIDCQGNLYAGDNNTVSIHDSDLNLLGSVALSNTAYDVLVAPSGYIYACGKNFVQCIAGATKLASVTVTPPHCGCQGVATAHGCGHGPFTYLWSNGATTQTISNLCAGTYTVTVKAGGCLAPSDTAIAHIPVGGGGGITVTADSVAATCTNPGSASITVVGGTPPYTYHWSTGATTSSINGLGAGYYCVGVHDNIGCSDTLCIHVNGTPLPIITITPNPDSVCAGGSVGLTAAGALTYVWTPAGSGLSCYNCSNPTASPAATTTYTVVGTDANGCHNKDSVVVKVNPLPVLHTTAVPDTVCAGGTIAINVTGGGAGATYAWTPAGSGLSCYNCPNPISTPTATTAYTVTGTDAQGCSANSSVTVYLQEPPTLTVQASQTGMCEGGSATLIASATSTTSPFIWQPGGMTGPNVTVTPTVTTIYTVSAASACGTALSTITITVNPLPVVGMYADIYNGCTPLCIQFRNSTTISQGAIAQYIWTFGNGDTLISKTPIYCYPSNGVYNVTLTATSDSGCSSTLKKINMITVYTRPVAAFTYSPTQTDIMQSTIQFTDNSKDAYGLVSWGWTFGDASDSTSNLRNPSHTYQDTGTYCPTLVVMNQHGCLDTATSCLVIDPIFTLYIPSAFSPNGDGRNDVFMAKGNDIKSFEMYVFDRWGMQLFHSTDINKGWNGTVNGGANVAQEDTYIYMITAYDSKNRKHTYTGNVNLIK